MQGWGERRRPKKVPGAAPLGCFSLSPVHLCSLFKLPPPTPPPPSPYTQQDYGDWWCRFFFFHFSSQTKFRKHQLSACVHVWSRGADLLCRWSSVRWIQTPWTEKTAALLFFLMYTTCMFSCMFAWGDAPVSNEAVFVLIKRGGGARARWGMGTFESHTMRDETASNIHHDVPCGT